MNQSRSRERRLRLKNAKTHEIYFLAKHFIKFMKIFTNTSNKDKNLLKRKTDIPLEPARSFNEYP